MANLAELFDAHPDVARGIAASYQALLGGVPTQAGFSYLIATAIQTNFGSYRSDVVFNEENIFINLTNSLIKGNADALTGFNGLTGAASSLTARLESVYRALVPAEEQSQAGLDYITRPDALDFYRKVAAERGIEGDDGAAIVGLASLLKILVDRHIGLGNDVNDLWSAVGNDTAALPQDGSALTDIDIADGDFFDADENGGTGGGGGGVGNQPPVAAPDSYTAITGTTLTVVAASGVLVNDVDADGDPLLAVLAADVSNGTLVLGSNGGFAYTPSAGFIGVDSFTYVATDGTGQSAAVTVTLTVRDNAPVAVADSYTIAQNGSLAATAATGVLFNDLDADGDPLSAILVSDVANGTLSLNTDGSFVYTPNAGFNGSDSFTYMANDGDDDSNVVTVSITVEPAPAGTVRDFSWRGNHTISDWTSADVISYQRDGGPAPITYVEDATVHPSLFAAYNAAEFPPGPDMAVPVSVAFFADSSAPGGVSALVLIEANNGEAFADYIITIVGIGPNDIAAGNFVSV